MTTTAATPFLNQPHHDPSERWVSNPRPGPGETVTVDVDVPTASGFDRLLLRTMHDGEGRWIDGASEPTTNGSRWRFELPCHNEIVPYRFWCDGRPGPHWLTGIGLIDYDPTDHHDFKLTTSGGAPAWVPEVVWYQIFPDRFWCSDPDRPLPDWAQRASWTDEIASGPAAMTQIYGGDLDGIAQRLDHLVDLGIGGVYLNPIFPARSNHRYDASSFDRVDEILGGDEALIRLRRACDDAGLRLMVDLTLNHTGDGHEWFEAAKADPNSPEAGFYYFKDHPHDYESWLGVTSLPKLDHSSAELRRRFYEGPDSVLARFLAQPLGMDGWRVDVANMTGRYGRIDHNRDVRRAARATVDQVDPDRWLLGEHFFDASADVDGPGWHGVMNYAGVARPVASWLGRFATLEALAAGPGQDPRDGDAMGRSVDAVRASLPWQFVLGSMALLGSHDTARWHTMAVGRAEAMVGVGLLFGLPGAPCMLYGDEIGLVGDSAEAARAPMPWNEDSWDQDLLARYRQLITVRGSSPALAHGGFRWVHRSAERLVFLRESTDERILVDAARASVPALDVGRGALGATGAKLLAGSGEVTADGERLTFGLDGPAVAFWRLHP